MDKKDADQQILRGLLDSLVLFHLLNGPDYGFSIRSSLGQFLDNSTISIKEATLYPLLHRLEQNAYLSSFLQPGDRGRPRKYYQITSEGRRFLEQRIEEWSAVYEILSATILGHQKN